jgi:hypothetical protein
MDRTLEDLRSFIAYQMREGFDSAHEIIENAAHYASEQHGRDDLQPTIKQIAAELMAAHRAEEADWEGPTDCDRLDEAFSALNRRGIVARQNFSCCNNCGFEEIWDEVEKAEKADPVEGYVFYHFQCIERAIESGELPMAYGSVEEDEEALRRVATAVVAELRGAGLSASWEGTAEHPILVKDIVWRRRRSA